MEKVVIIGSGPAGLTAAIYTARAALTPLVIEGLQPGGQLTTTTVIENWPGFEDGIDGNKLMQDMRKQAVLKIEKKGDHFSIEREYDNPILTKSIIVATGAKALTLPLPNVAKLMGYGVSTCAVCDGFFYKNKSVVVVGGGDSAMEEAMYLSKLASRVTLIHRRDKFRASKAMQDRVFENSKIKIIYNTEILELKGNDQGLYAIVTQNMQGEKNELTLSDSR
jgi:thioredoxin reductase (NADPH)